MGRSREKDRGGRRRKGGAENVRKERERQREEREAIRKFRYNK